MALAALGVAAGALALFAVAMRLRPATRTA
jgi:hypothetical protein